MKPKPITTTDHVVACFERKPRYLCRGRAGWVVVTDPVRAERFADAAAAGDALEQMVRVGFRDGCAGDWRVYARTTRTAFVEIESAPA